MKQLSPFASGAVTQTMLLAASGGEVGNTATELPRLLSAQVRGCGASVIHDNGCVVYLTVSGHRDTAGTAVLQYFPEVAEAGGKT